MLTQVQTLGRDDPLEKGMATRQSSILAWKIPWQEEPGGLQSMVTKRWIGLSNFHLHTFFWLPRWFSGKNCACQAGDMGLVPGSGRSPEEGNGNPLQHSCLGNPADGGAWWATGQRVAESWTQHSG